MKDYEYEEENLDDFMENAANILSIACSFFQYDNFINILFEI